MKRFTIGFSYEEIGTCVIAAHTEGEAERILYSHLENEGLDDIKYKTNGREYSTNGMGETEEGPTLVYASEDYAIQHTHESKPHPQAFSSNYTYSVVAIFSTREAAERECAKDKYKWRGNGTGSVSWDVVKRSEVHEEATWEC